MKINAEQLVWRTSACTLGPKAYTQQLVSQTIKCLYSESDTIYTIRDRPPHPRKCPARQPPPSGPKSTAVARRGNTTPITADHPLHLERRAGDLTKP